MFVACSDAEPACIPRARGNTEELTASGTAAVDGAVSTLVLHRHRVSDRPNVQHLVPALGSLSWSRITSERTSCDTVFLKQQTNWDRVLQPDQDR